MKDCRSYSELLQTGVISPYSILLSSASHGQVWYLLSLFFLFLFLASTSLSSRSCWRTAIWSKATSSSRFTNENAKFGSILYPIAKYAGNILDTPGTFVLNSKYIWRTFYVFQLHFFEFLDTRTVFGSYSRRILTAFIQHSRHLPTTEFRSYSDSNQLHSYGIRSAFWTLWQPSEYSYYVPPTFESQYTRNVPEAFDAGSQWIRSIRTAFFKTWHSRPNVAQILEIVNSGWFCFIPAKCDGCLRKLASTSAVSEGAKDIWICWTVWAWITSVTDRRMDA